jgi:hypothetical protein
VDLPGPSQKFLPNAKRHKSPASAARASI